MNIEPEDIQITEVDTGIGRKFFRRLDWSAFWGAFILSFVVYCYTLAPTVTLEDAGELATAGDALGVPHPPGYPIWTMLAWVFTRVFRFVQFRGQPNPAWSIGLLSAVFGALASGVTALLVCRSGSDMLRRSRHGSDSLDPKIESAICWISGVSASLLFAFSPIMWSQSVIIEVYSLNAFFLALIFLFVYWWMEKPTNHLLYVTAFVFGLGLTNYQVLLLAALALGVAMMLRNVALFRDFVIVGILFGITVTIMKLGSMNPQPGFPKLPPLNPSKYGTALIEPSKYILLITSVTFVIAMCMVTEFMRKTKEWPLVPLALTGLGVLVVLLLLASVPTATPIPEVANKETFSWAKYILGFLGAMIVLGALCFTLPKGRMVGVAFITIELVLAVLLKKGALLGLVHPSAHWFHFYILLNFVFLGLAFFYLPHGRTIALTFLFTELGVAFYGYMPIVSELRNPPMNWAYPRTWQGFKHAITRGQYEKLAPSDAFSMYFVRQIGAYLTDLRKQFTIPCVLLGFLPFTIWRVRIGERRFKAVYAAIGLSILASVFVILEKLFPGTALLSTLIKIPIAIVIAFLGIGGIAILVNINAELIHRLTTDTRATLSEKLMTALVLMGELAALLLFLVIIGSKLGAITAPPPGDAAMTAAQLREMIKQCLGVIAMIIAPIAGILGVVFAMRSRIKLRMDIDIDSQKWIVATLLGFLTMSIILINLANLKMDIQDTFIQRVKFISSHALYVLWIGYGLVFGLALVNKIFRNSRTLQYLSLGVAALLPLIPLQQNGYNKELLRTYGGAEQNGHDFGWQFGNYQLRGADAILEELSPDEEPLPNPNFPPEMTRDAIFYGGTDPGRFVPTYMIYGAQVRPDVYLITQNALADNTYMSVMRDLYGDQIWIPAQHDSAKAFQRYVDEVNRGVRPKNADLKIENGRVQVSGALGVMEINGILAQMIFEQCNYKHDFYVEESYVIRWMYPYLTPHGLIMKINDSKTGISGINTRDDQDFWDWYTRRLVGNRKFTRDIVARKSFSKLRSAIGGLYGSRMKLADAERAYHQARILYPLSPEANFRLVQEILMRQGRFEEARDIMTDFSEQDPANTKVKQFLKHLDKIKDLAGRIKELEAKRNKGKIDIKSAIRLVDLYRQAQRKGHFLQMAKNILATKNMLPQFYVELAAVLLKGKEFKLMDEALQGFMKKPPPNTPPQMYLSIAKMYAQAQKPDKMSSVLAVYLKMRPSDWRAWLDQGSLQVAMRNNDKAIDCLETALRAGGDEALKVIQSDKRFASIRNKAIERSRKRLIGIPGAPAPGPRPIPGIPQ
ncbi:MAG: DUF2723 domain-containing protein [Kiritimatiellia bacterium]|jgi:hypothetical protein|nr:DUF2723 domain-containing protein [Kiritimatiellia bacterium]